MTSEMSGWSSSLARCSSLTASMAVMKCCTASATLIASPRSSCTNTDTQTDSARSSAQQPPLPPSSGRPAAAASTYLDGVGDGGRHAPLEPLHGPRALHVVLRHERPDTTHTQTCMQTGPVSHHHPALTSFRAQGHSRAPHALEVGHDIGLPERRLGRLELRQQLATCGSILAGTEPWNIRIRSQPRQQ